MKMIKVDDKFFIMYEQSHVFFRQISITGNNMHMRAHELEIS